MKILAINSRNIYRILDFIDAQSPAYTKVFVQLKRNSVNKNGWFAKENCQGIIYYNLLLYP